ncbi:MAG: hypothetical protein MZW92_11815 [Comamonadaceae bacterium]|nr:hypothetical protein [Comamonadaceae bacterium]
MNETGAAAAQQRPLHHRRLRRPASSSSRCATLCGPAAGDAARALRRR